MLKPIRAFLKLLKKDFRKHYLNQRKLSKYPRYHHTKAYFKGRKIEIVDPVTFIKGYKEIFTNQCYNFISEIDNPFILDCGSNIGLSVLYFKLKYPNANIIAFEPDPHIFKVLQRNINIFDFKDVELVNKAIWIKDENIEFMTEGGWSGRITKPGDVKSVISIPAIRLKNLLNKRIDFLKIDIEGAENLVINDCADVLTNVKNLFIEYHSHHKEEQSLGDLLTILKNSGFRYQIHEAYVNRHPFLEIKTIVGMDLQLNIYAYRNQA